MKQFYLLTVFLMFCSLGFGQDNRSDGQVLPNFLGATPPQQFSGQEIFRFQPGVITQLNNGSNFNFNNARWFSIGELNTGSQDVFGLRFQLNRRGVTFGYQDINDDNPRIQWIDDRTNPGDLEFRFANDTLSTTSTLVAKMTNNGKTLFGDEFLVAPDTRVQITNDINGENVGLYAETFSVNQGTAISANSFNNDINIGVRGRASDIVTALNFAYGVNGEAEQNSNGNSFAGYFDGDVNVTGTLTHGSDRKLKDNLKETESVLSRLSQLKSYTYNFKPNKDINLPLGLQYGFIAQELEEVYPDLVSQVVYPIYNDKQEIISTDTYKSVNYIGLISELTAAIKELNAKVKKLEGQLETRVVYGSKFSSEELDKINKNAYQLQQNIPNPFSDSSIISYALPENQKQASILVFDLNGRLINTYDVNQTRGEIKINATDLNGAGMYLYTLFANGEEVITKRMILK